MSAASDRSPLLTGAELLGSYDLAHGVRQVGLVDQLPVACLLDGFTIPDDFKARTSTLLRSGWETSLDDDGVRVLPATEPAVRWALEQTTRQRLASPYEGKTFLSLHLADTLKIAGLRAAYRQLHPGQGLAGYDAWHALSGDVQGQAAIQAACDLAAGSRRSWTQELCKLLAGMRAFALEDQFEHAVADLAAVDVGDGLTVYLQPAPAEHFVLLRAGQLLLTLSRTDTSGRWDAVSMPVQGDDNGGRQPIHTAQKSKVSVDGVSVQHGLSADAALGWLRQHAGDQPLSLCGCGTGRRSSARLALQFSRLNAPVQAVRYLTARSGKPGSYRLDTREKLRQRARELGVRGFTGMDTGELLQAIAAAAVDQAGQPDEPAFLHTFRYRNLAELAELTPQDDDPSAFEATVAAAVGGRFCHPGLALVPSRLTGTHRWRVLARPISPYAGV